MLVKDILQKCDKNIDICVDMSNTTADYLAENCLIENNIYYFKPHDLLDAHVNGTPLAISRNDENNENEILRAAQEIVVSSKVKSLNKFLAAGGTIECFCDLEVDYFDQNNQGQFIIHVKEI